MDAIGARPAILPLIELNRAGAARLLAWRPLFSLPDGGIGARIRGMVRPVLLDAHRLTPFAWQRRPWPGPALPLDAVPRLTRRELEAEVAALLAAHGEGWSPPAVREAARAYAAAALAHDIRMEAVLDDL